jgi:hypothetical protein
MRIGFDLDGVLAEIRVAELELIRIAVKNGADEDLLEEGYYSSLRPLLDARDFVGPDDDAVVITSRPERLAGVTRRWLNYYYPQFDYYMVAPPADWRDGDPRKAVAMLKAAKIRQAGVAVYFDDDPVVVGHLRSMVNIPVVKFGGRTS